MINILFFILGSVLGSFFNVCIYRIPRQISLVFPSSFCPHCNHKINPIFNIPILGYIFLKGKCKYCKNKISFVYPLVEIITACLYLILFQYFGLNLFLLKFLIFISALIIVTFIDLEHLIIPDIISIPGVIVGFILSFFMPEKNIISSLIGILSGFGILYFFAWFSEIVFHKEGMGGGDLKLIAMIGAFLGWKGVLLTILVASLSGTIISFSLIALKKKTLQDIIPFGPFLCLGALISVFWTDLFWSFYL